MKRSDHLLNKAKQIAFRADIKRWCERNGFPEPEFEVRFHPTRRWRFDIAWPTKMIALEIDGGIFIQGRHSRGAGILKDMEKKNAASALGWRVFLATPDTVRSPQTTADLKAVLG